MNDELTTYRIDNDGFKHYDTIEGPEGMLLSLIENGVLVPDTRLQAIADAWNADLNGLRRDLDWPELTDLLDALGGAK